MLDRNFSEESEQISRFKNELRAAYREVQTWKKKAEDLQVRLTEADRLLWPSRVTNAKVSAYFQKWFQIDDKKRCDA